MAHWLVKSEPSVWSWDQQVEAGAKGTHWNGVRNHVAKQQLMAMKIGDHAFFYHSNEGKEIVGYLRLPKAAGKVPLVYFATALDSRKEEWTERNEDLLDKGIGIFVTDMPGTGQAPIKVDVDAERMFSAALDYLSGLCAGV